MRILFLLAALLTSAALAPHGAAAGVLAQGLSVTVVSPDGTILRPNAPDGTTLTPPPAASKAAGARAAAAITGIWTSEGMWTFGGPANGNGDYPLLINGSNANGGFAALLQVTNGNLYARQASGAYWVRWAPGLAWVKGGAPAQGTTAAKISLAVVAAKVPDNAPAGTVIANATVTMSPTSAQFTGPLVSTNPLYAAQGNSVVLSRDLTPADDGVRAATITAVQ